MKNYYDKSQPYDGGNRRLTKYNLITYLWRVKDERTEMYKTLEEKTGLNWKRKTYVHITAPNKDQSVYESRIGIKYDHRKRKCWDEIFK